MPPPPPPFGIDLAYRTGIGDLSGARRHGIRRVLRIAPPVPCDAHRMDPILQPSRKSASRFQDAFPQCVLPIRIIPQDADQPRSGRLVHRNRDAILPVVPGDLAPAGLTSGGSDSASGLGRFLADEQFEIQGRRKLLLLDSFRDQRTLLRDRSHGVVRLYGHRAFGEISMGAQFARPWHQPRGAHVFSWAGAFRRAGHVQTRANVDDSRLGRDLRAHRASPGARAGKAVGQPRHPLPWQDQLQPVSRASTADLFDQNPHLGRQLSSRQIFYGPLHRPRHAFVLHPACVVALHRGGVAVHPSRAAPDDDTLISPGVR